MRPFLLAVLSGVLLALSLPPHDLSLLAWFALAPMLMAAWKYKPLEAAGLGLIVGAMCGLIHARWSGGAALIFAWLPFLWFGMLCALASIAFRAAMFRGVTADQSAKSSLARVFFVACVGVAGEWLTTLTPLPINFAVTQHRVLDIIQIADITGIWGVSFLLWFANVSIANAFVLQKERAPRRISIAPIAVSSSLILLSIAYSMMVLTQRQTTKMMRVAAIQDFDDAEVQQVAPQARTSTRNAASTRETMTRDAAKRGAKLIVWSENCLGSDFDANSKRDATKMLARNLKIFLVPGYTDSSGERQTNCAAIINPNGEIVGVHRKIHLFLAERQTTQAGTAVTSFSTSLGKIGMAICFDTCWTNILRDETKSGAQIIAMPNFDPPAPRGVVHFLHGAMLPFRAIENRVPIVRADPNGQSGTIDTQGRVLDALPMWKSGASLSDVRLGDGKPTFFAQTGDWLAWLCVAFATIGIGFGRAIAPKVARREHLANCVNEPRTK